MRTRFEHVFIDARCFHFRITLDALTLLLATEALNIHTQRRAGKGRWIPICLILIVFFTNVIATRIARIEALYTPFFTIGSRQFTAISRPCRPITIGIVWALRRLSRPLATDAGMIRFGSRCQHPHIFTFLCAIDAFGGGYAFAFVAFLARLARFFGTPCAIFTHLEFRVADAFLFAIFAHILPNGQATIGSANGLVVWTNIDFRVPFSIDAQFVLVRRDIAEFALEFSVGAFGLFGCGHACILIGIAYIAGRLAWLRCAPSSIFFTRLDIRAIAHFCASRAFARIWLCCVFFALGFAVGTFADFIAIARFGFG